MRIEDLIGDKSFLGCFVLNPGTEKEILVPNTLLANGSEYFLRTIFRAEAILPANFYIGLTNIAGTFSTTTLADLAAGEPTGGGSGYARQAAARGLVDWTVSSVNGMYRARSKNLVFTATTDWDKVWNRMFLCSVLAGTVGQLFAVSAPLAEDQAVVMGAPPTVVYDFWMRR